jgi:hypothetical protein
MDTRGLNQKGARLVYWLSIIVSLIILIIFTAIGGPIGALIWIAVCIISYNVQQAKGEQR